jgi:hypothetical protein
VAGETQRGDGTAQKQSWALIALDAGDRSTPSADSLNSDKVPTAQDGSKWHAATVRHVLLRTL